MTTVNLDDYYGNIVTLYFPDEHNYPTTIEWLSMQSKDSQVSAELEITKWSDFFTVSTYVIPDLVDYDEYFDNEQELCDWIRSLSYQYGMCLIRNN